MIESLKRINKPWDKLDCVHIDALSQQCGMFEPGSNNNNGYGCKSKLNTESPGCCHVFSCPIATEADEEDPQWGDSLERGEWLIVHSEFVEAQS